jgi:hypothetical protein
MVKFSWANIVSYALNVAFGLLLLYTFAYIAKEGQYLHTANGFILYFEIVMAVCIVVFGIAMLISNARGK